MRVILILLFTLSLTYACNTTEYVILRNKNETDQGLVLRTKSRCDGVRCLYHDECDSLICLKVDNENRGDIEGICSS